MSTNNSGTTNIASVDAAIIPPNTVLPIVLRLPAAAPVAKANGNTPRMNASDVIAI